MFLLIPEYEQRVNIGSALREIFDSIRESAPAQRRIRMRTLHG
jgi:hypothetical protein